MLPTLIYEAKPFVLLAGAWFVSPTVPESALLKLSVLALFLAGSAILFLRYESRYAKKKVRR